MKELAQPQRAAPRPPTAEVPDAAKALLNRLRVLQDRHLKAERDAVRVMLAALKKAHIELAGLTQNPSEAEPYFGIACPNDADAACVAGAYDAVRDGLAAAEAAGIKAEGSSEGLPERSEAPQ